ncbi:MAG: tRNA pseudouridine(55) synthase TruB [Schleiferiaceae bacterium]|nr:tRNA pseudouridine(55) synthase TruB [Schleiferiaceae bacterium]
MSLSLEEYQAGQVLLIDKPLEWSSFQAVNKIKHGIKRKFNIKKIKVGHAGTLDPMATGLLIVCTGKATKTIQSIQDTDKEYTGTITLGIVSASYDSEGPFIEICDYSHVTEDMIIETTNQFKGDILQAPPIFSALKKDGKPLYEYARAGEEVEIKKRPVRIDAFEITRIELPEIDFRIACTKGTYIRSIAHDFGKALNSGSYLSALRRTKIGDYNVDDATLVNEWEV